MSDLTPAERLAKLRTLEQWLDWQLHDTRRKIQTLERQAEQVGYISEQAIREGHPLGCTIHIATCAMITRPVTGLTADKARQALADTKFFQACEFCDPRKTLGIGKG